MLRYRQWVTSSPYPTKAHNPTKARNCRHSSGSTHPTTRKFVQHRASSSPFPENPLALLAFSRSPSDGRAGAGLQVVLRQWEHARARSLAWLSAAAAAAAQTVTQERSECGSVALRGSALAQRHGIDRSADGAGGGSCSVQVFQVQCGRRRARRGPLLRAEEKTPEKIRDEFIRRPFPE